MRPYSCAAGVTPPPARPLRDRLAHRISLPYLPPMRQLQPRPTALTRLPLPLPSCPYPPVPTHLSLPTCPPDLPQYVFSKCSIAECLTYNPDKPGRVVLVPRPGRPSGKSTCEWRRDECRVQLKRDAIAESLPCKRLPPGQEAHTPHAPVAYSPAPSTRLCLPVSGLGAHTS